MAQQTINLGAAPDDGTGDTLRVGGDKINDNFTELYTDYLPKAGGTLTGDLVVPDEAYDATAWNGSLEVPTKNAVRDKIESLGSGITELDDIPDVNAPAPAAGDVLTWDDTPGEWVASPPPGGGAFSIDDATDVDTTSTPPNDGDVLTFDNGSGDWIPAAPSGGDLGALHIQDQRASGTATGNVTSGAWRARPLTTAVTNSISGASHVTSTVTISNASPGVVSWTGHGLAAGAVVIFSTTGALPTGLSIDTPYYVLSPNANDFTVSASPGGAAINTSSAGSGTHTANSSNFILPAGTYDITAPVMGHQTDATQGRLQNLTDATTTLLGLSARSRSTSSTDGTTTSTVQGRFVIAAQKRFELQHRVGTTSSFGSPTSWGTEVYMDMFIKKVG